MVFENTYKVLRRELGIIGSSPVHIVLMVILPLVAFGFFGAIFSKGVIRDMPVAVLDEDRTPLSRQAISMIDATPSANIIYTIADMDEGERLIREGKVYAVVQVPADFEKDILGNKTTRIAAYVSGLNITANGLLSKDLLTAVTTFSSGVQIQILMKQGLSETEAYAQMMPVYFDRHILFNPYVNYGYYLLPSFMPMMLMVFTILLTVYAIGSELKKRTAGQWMASASGHVWSALIGKMIPYTVTMCVMSLVMNIIMYKLLDVPLHGSPVLIVLGGFLFVLAYQSIGILIVTLLSNLRLSLSIAGGYSVLAFTFSGLTFPRMAMLPLLQVISYIFPFTVYTDIFIDQALRGAPALYTMSYVGILCIYIILPLLCLPRLKRISTDEKFWGRI